MLLSPFVSSLIDKLIHEKRFRTAETYRSTLSSVISFSHPKIMLLDIFTREWLSAYQEWLLSSGCQWNTVSFYMRILQRFYNLAIEEKGLPQVSKLFSGVFTGNDITMKRSLAPETIILLQDADFTDHPDLEFSRDMFVMSYHLHGVSFVDMCFLRKSNFKNGVLSYHRRKSGSLISTPVNREALRIIMQYSSLTKNSPYLLPIIDISCEDEYRQYQNALRNHNRRLKRIAAKLEIKEVLTSYVSRHSWATNAFHFGISTAIISQALGHRTETVTRIYLSKFDTEVLNDANETMRRALKKIKNDKRKKGKKNNVHLCFRERHDSGANINILF